MSPGVSPEIRLAEIAELLGVYHQRASQLADEPGFPGSDRRYATPPAVGASRGRGVGEAVAR